MQMNPILLLLLKIGLKKMFKCEKKEDREIGNGHSSSLSFFKSVLYLCFSSSMSLSGERSGHLIIILLVFKNI